MADNENNVTESLSGGIGMSDIAREVLDNQSDEIVEPKVVAKEQKGQKSTSSDAQGSDEASDVDVEEVVQNVQNEEAKKNSKQWKLKANGKEYTVDSEDKLVNAAQRGIAAEQAWMKAKSEIDSLRATMQRQLKEIESDKELAKKDLASFIKKHNNGAEDLAEQLLLDRAREAMAMENMTPREKDLYLQNKKYQEQMKQKEESEKEAQAKADSELVEQQKEHIGQIFTKALTEYKIPANTTTIRVMSAIYRAALQKGVELNAEQAAQLTKKQLEHISSQSQASLEEMKAEEFIKKYPKLTEAIRKHLVAKASGRPGEAEDIPRKSSKSDGKPAKKLDSGKDWDKYIDKLRQEGSALRVKSGW